MKLLLTKGVSFIGLALTLLCVSLSTQNAEGANILGLFTSHSPSHLIVHMSVAKALAEKGHNVTVVCTLPPKVTHPSIRQIVIPARPEQDKELNDLMTEIVSEERNIFSHMLSLVTSLGILTEMQFEALQSEQFAALYKNPDTKFDLVIMGYFLNDFELAVAAKFKCPVALSWMGQSMTIINKYLGNPAELSYVPNFNMVMQKGEIMNFGKRLQNVFIDWFFGIITYFFNKSQTKYYNRLFPDDDLPTFDEMKKNISMAFCNYHYISEGPIRPNVPTLIEIGGIQIKPKPDPLPLDIEKFLNSSSTNGAILFSLGSNVQGSHVNPNVVKVIFKTLSGLKQNVIWKWEDEQNTPGKASNILYKKWVPQDDILAHPNLKLFITHAGKGGLTEAEYHGVPMVALPVFGDQNDNAARMAAHGYGLHLPLRTLTEAQFKNALHEVLTNSTYASNVKKFSNLYRDRPLTARETAVFWTEYLIRHHGAPHMQSPLVHMNAIQSNNVDVIVCLVLIIYVSWRLLKFTFKFVCRKFCKKCKSQDDSKAKQKKKNQ